MKDYRPVQVTTEKSVENPLYDSEAKGNTFTKENKRPHPFFKGKEVSIKSKRTNEPLVFSGHFHGFGVGFEEYDEGPANFTTAIVEKNNGEVVEVEPSEIRFLDR